MQRERKGFRRTVRFVTFGILYADIEVVDISARCGIASRNPYPREYGFLPVTQAITPGGVIQSPPYMLLESSSNLVPPDFFGLYQPIPPPHPEFLMFEPHGALRGGALDPIPHGYTPAPSPLPRMGQVFQAIEAPPPGASEQASHWHSTPFYAAPGHLGAPSWPHEAVTNIHGGSFVSGNVNNIVRNGESGTSFRSMQWYTH
jgi:hypothetical protein